MAPVLTDKAANNLEVDPKRTNNNGVDEDESDEGFVSPSVQRLIGQKKRKDSTTSRSSSSYNNSSSSASDNDSTHTDSSSSSSSSPPSGAPSQNTTNSIHTDSSSASPPSGASSQNTTNSEDEVDKVNGTPTTPPPTAVTRRKTTETPEGGGGNATNNNNIPPAAASTGETAVSSVSRESVEVKAESLANYIVYTLLGKPKHDPSVESNDPVERTLLRCVKSMQQKHEILFKGMMKRLRVTPETGYVSFVTVANTLFEDEKMVVTWSRIVALYAFGGRLAMYCKENDMDDLAFKVACFMGKYAREVVTTYVASVGGWSKICDEFPEESDIENKIRRVLSWTAVGLGVAATVSYLTSR